MRYRFKPGVSFVLGLVVGFALAATIARADELTLDLSNPDDVAKYMSLLGWEKRRGADPAAQLQCARRMVLSRGASPGSVKTLGWYYIPELEGEVAICASDASIDPKLAEAACRGLGYDMGLAKGPVLTCFRGRAI